MEGGNILSGRPGDNTWVDEDKDTVIAWKNSPYENNTFKQDLWAAGGKNESSLFFDSYGADLSWADTDYPDWELPQSAQTLLIALYSITTLLAVVGNILVIAVLVLGNRVKTELTVFLVNLALADLIMAFFCMPFTFTKVMLGRWIFGSFMCPYVSFMQVTSVAVSIFTNMAIGIDRYWGVIYPLKPKLTKTRAKFALIVIWVAAMALASAQLVVARSTQQMYGDKRFWDCDEKWRWEEARHSYTLAVVSMTYVIPLGVLCFTYYKIIKMVVTLVVVFAVCWLPLHLFTLLLDFVPQLSILKSPTDEHIFFGVYYSCHWLAMANSFVNPIIYSFLNESFRADLQALFSWLPCVKRMRTPTDTRTRTMSTRASTRTYISQSDSRNSRPLANDSSRSPQLRGGQLQGSFSSSKYQMKQNFSRASCGKRERGRGESQEVYDTNELSDRKTVVLKAYDNKFKISEKTTKC